MFGIIEDRRGVTLIWTQRAICALIFSVCFLFAGFSVKHIKQYFVESKVFQALQKQVDATESDIKYRCEGRSSVAEVLVSHAESLAKCQLSKIKVAAVNGSDVYEVLDLGFNNHLAKRVMREAKIKIFFPTKRFAYLSDFQFWSLSNLKDLFTLFNGIRLVVLDVYGLTEDAIVSLAIGSQIDSRLAHSLLVSAYFLSFLCYEKGANLYMQLNTLFSFLSWDLMNICLMCLALLCCSEYSVRMLCKLEGQLAFCFVTF